MKKMKIQHSFTLAILILMGMTISGCQKGDLVNNPNAATTNSVVPVSLILNHITATFIRNEEVPFFDVCKYDQYMVSIFSKYWGNNEYSWNYSDHNYDMLKYVVQMESQSVSQLGTTNKYLALAKFFRAYQAIWLSQRVGDIPMVQAGDANFPTPAYDTQKEVYRRSLALLDTANTILNTLIGTGTQGSTFDAGGDIFSYSNLQWRKLINTYRLRVLINLSKRADDNADLNIKSQFSAIVTNPTLYPVMTGNADNLVYKWTATNQFPVFATGNAAYNNFMNVGKTYLDLTTSTKDPRTFAVATPTTAAPINDFNAYIGADSKLDLTTLQNNSAAGKASFFNGARYFGSNTGATTEPFVFIGYPEMCFNIAEAINRGWVTGLTATDAKSWYDKGVAASCTNYGIDVTKASNTLTVSDLAGKALGTVTTDNTTFLTNIAYDVATPANALKQILNQKYVAMFMNSGIEPFMNFRRTGIPVFSSGGTGTGTTFGIPRRWLYPIDEINFNSTNYKASITTQFGGADDVTKDTWLTK